MHDGEYRSRPDGLHARPEDPTESGLTLAEIQSQIRRLKRAKGFDIALDQRLAYLTAEVGEVAAEVLKPPATETAISAKWTPGRGGPWWRCLA